MKKILLLAIFLFGIVYPTIFSKSLHNSKPKPINRWEKEIQVFEDWDRKNTYPHNAVLFVGSSSIRLWNTRECFPQLPVLNRGFGGAQIVDINHFAERIVLPYKPDIIVFFAGGNDISEGKTSLEVLTDFKS